MPESKHRTRRRRRRSGAPAVGRPVECGASDGALRTLTPERIARLEVAIAEERRRSNRPARDSAAILSGLRASLEPVANHEHGSQDDVALVPVSRRTAQDIIRAVDHAFSIRTELRYLRAAAARAIIAARDRKTSETTVRRLAMRQLEGELLHVDLAGPHRRSRFNSFQVIRTYLTLTQAKGRFEFEYRSLEALAERKEPITISCLVSREEAFDILADLYGFKSGSAALRYLIQVRKSVRDSEVPPGLTKEQLRSFLADLPFLPGSRK